MIYIFREKRALLLNEIALRKKALLIEDFPNQELIDEFLIRKDPIPMKIDIQWKQPQVNEFIVSFIYNFISLSYLFLLNLYLYYKLICVRILWTDIYLGNHSMLLKKYFHW